MSNVESIIHRDLRLSYIVAPLRFIAPVIGYIALYPIIIKNYGLGVLGLWGLLAAIPQALASMDFGFSLILTREAGGQAGHGLEEVKKKYRIAQRILLLIVPLLFVVTAGIVIYGDLPVVDYRTSALSFAVTVMVLAVIIQRFAALDMAILNGRGDNYFVHFVGAVTPVIFLSVSILGALSGAPLEALSIGFLLANLSAWIAYKLRTRANHFEWIAVSRDRGQPIGRREVVGLLRNGAYLYAASLGMMLRDPILRYVIGILLGLEAAAIYEIAIRVGRTGREIVAAGFSALFPSYATLMRTGSKKHIEQVTRESLFLLLVAGGTVLGSVYVLIPWVYGVWLGAADNDLILATRIVCIWSAITLCNTPFWYQLIAGKGEKEAAIAIWLHTISIIALFPILTVLNVKSNLTVVLLYWLVGSILTQIAIFHYAEKRFGIVKKVFSTRRIIVTIIAILGVVMSLIRLLEHEFISYPGAIGLIALATSLGLFYSRSYLAYWVSRRPNQVIAK